MRGVKASGWGICAGLSSGWGWVFLLVEGVGRWIGRAVGFVVVVFLSMEGMLFWGRAQYVLIPMDEEQVQHLQAYGVMYRVLAAGSEGWWLLNYRGGSFAFPYRADFVADCQRRGVVYHVLSTAQWNRILEEIHREDRNMDALRLVKAPRIAVYAPPDIEPWDDAVLLALNFVDIPYDRIYDDEVLAGKLVEYDWLHLHHEDFTGQYGKFWAAYRHTQWYQERVRFLEAIARKHGFQKVSQLKLAVARKIKEFLAGGGYLFAMCSATDTYDIALAAHRTDICQSMFDGDPADPNANDHLDFSQTIAFQNFHVILNPYVYEFSDIDMTHRRKVPRERDFFVLYEFSAKLDPIPTMLTQNHTRVIKGFMGQTTAFDRTKLKPYVVVLGENRQAGEVRYLFAQYGQGFFAFLGGHDPEDYQHFVGDPPTDLSRHPSSPGYRLILNNVLFPAAKPKKKKT